MKLPPSLQLSHVLITHVARQLLQHKEPSRFQTDSRGEVVIVQNHPLVGVAAVVVLSVQSAPFPRGSTHHEPISDLRRQTIGNQVTRPLHYSFTIHKLLSLLVEVADGCLLYHDMIADCVVVVARANTRRIRAESLQTAWNNTRSRVKWHVVDFVHLEHSVQGAPGGLANDDVRFVICELRMHSIITGHADQSRAMVQTIDFVLIVRCLSVVMGKSVPIANITIVVCVLDLPLGQVLQREHNASELRAPVCRGWQTSIPHTHRQLGDRGICGDSSTPYPQ